MDYGPFNIYSGMYLCDDTVENTHVNHVYFLHISCLTSFL